MHVSLTFVVLHLALRARGPSSMSYLLVLPPGKTRPSLRLALLSEIVSQWPSGHFLESSLRCSFSSQKQHYSAMMALLGLGLLLLYKRTYINFLSYILGTHYNIAFQTML